MKIEIKADEVARVVKIAKVSLTDAVKILIDGTKKKNGIAVAQVVTCDGNSQTHVSFPCQMESDEQVSFIAGPEFLAVLGTMAETGDSISVELDKDRIKISCKGSKTEIGVKQQMKTLEINKDSSTVNVNMNMEDLKNVISYGGYCSSRDEGHGVKNLIEFVFEFDKAEEDKKPFLQVHTTDFYKGARCRCNISNGICASQEGGKPKLVHASGRYVYTLDCSRMQNMASLLTDGEAKLFLNPGQVVVANNGVIFVFRAFDKKYPEQLNSIFEIKQSKAEIVVAAADVKVAAELISLVSDTDKEPMLIYMEDDKLILADVLLKSVNKISAQIEGSFEKMGMKKEIMMNGVIKMGSEKVTILINEPTTPVFIKGDKHSGVFFAAPIRMKKEK